MSLEVTLFAFGSGFAGFAILDFRTTVFFVDLAML